VNEFLEFLTKFVTAGKTLTADEARTLSTKLRESPITQPLYQGVFDAGHAAATAKGNEKVTELQASLTAKSDEVTKLTQEVTALKADKPDIVAVEAKYQKDITGLQAQLKEEKLARRDERRQWHVSQAHTRLQSALVEAGVDPEYAELLLSKEDIKKRFKVVTSGDEVTIEVLKEGSETIPLQADNPTKAFADELRRNVKPQFIRSNGDRGSGASGGGDGGGGKSVYDRIREEAKGTQEAGSKVTSGAQRLGILGAGAP
jgi:hypothetical protein